MRPLRLRLENVHSFRGEHEIEFAPQPTVLVGPNGAGKTTLLDAIRFGLWGATRGALDSIITEGEQHCRVEFEFDLGGDRYLVSRQRSRKGAGATLLSFQCNGQVLDGKTVAETQRRIEQTLRMTDELFCATACAAQGDAARFSRARPAERKAVLGEILDLGAWERRAEVARQMGRDLGAQIEADGKRLDGLRAAAAEAEDLRDQLAANGAAQEDLDRQLATLEGEQREAEEAKAALLRDREADRARRKELDELVAQLGRSRRSLSDAAARLEGLRRAGRDKAAILDALRRSEEAQTYAQELEARRQEALRLETEVKRLESAIKAERAAHQAEVRRLEGEIARARAEYEAEIRRREERLAMLRQQAEVLDDVPCGRGPGLVTESVSEMLLRRCPLLAQAREAAAALAPEERELVRIKEEGDPPWAGLQRQHDELRRGDPAAPLVTDLSAARSALAEIEYDPKEHDRARREAAQIERLRGALTSIERAEAQAMEAQRGLEQLQAQVAELEQRQAALEAELGPPRDWDAMIAAADRRILSARSVRSSLQARAHALQQQRGALQERLRAAEQAGEEAEELAVALRASERRLQVLKVLAQAFSKAGIPALLIEQAVPELEAVANETLATLSDGRMSLALVSQRETKAKTVQETLDILVSDDRGQRPYESFSGGEAMRVDLALRVGLSALLAARAGARCELLVLDETCAPLDAQGRALFVEALQRVAERFATILVVTHVDELKDLFPVRFQVSKDAEGSRVEVVAS